MASPILVENESQLYTDADYKPILSNWYTAKPYGFKFTPKGGTPIILYLPINPNNINITTNFATNITATIFGTVEEHSPVRYYDIQIEGTTGMGPKYVTPDYNQPSISLGRSSFSIKQGIDNGAANGFFAKTISLVSNLVQVGQGIGEIPTTTGLKIDQTGYAAFHNFYRFLLKYKKDVSGTDSNRSKKRDAHPLVFFNYKDNNQYKVVIKTMTLRRDKEDPMLYVYNISMRGYDLSPVEDKLANNTSQEILDALGLNGVQNSSALTTLKKYASDAKSTLGALGAGISQIGR